MYVDWRVGLQVTKLGGLLLDKGIHPIGEESELEAVVHNASIDLAIGCVLVPFRRLFQLVVRSEDFRSNVGNMNQSLGDRAILEGDCSRESS